MPPCATALDLPKAVGPNNSFGEIPQRSVHYPGHSSMARISVIIFLCLAASCRNKNLTSIFQNHKFDKEVIDKLPLYDSLTNVLLENYPSIRPHIEPEGSYRYLPAEDGNDLDKVLPKPGADKVKQYLSQLGADFIYGIDVFKDSTIRISVRDTYIQADHLHIRERLSFLPKGGSFQEREFPVKDTILNRNWQYWISFDEQFLF